MRANVNWKQAGTAAGLGALIFTVGCGGVQSATGVRAQTVEQGGAPILVGCEPNQRALVRPAVVNGAAVSQVECVTTGQPVAPAQHEYVQPTHVAYAPSAPARVVRAPGGEVEDAQVVPVRSYPTSAAQPVRTQQVVYDDRPVVRERRGRSVKKSAVIIGSSAGVGAGVGAAVGGKKGALIGAVLGGGGAAVWDQISRRKP